MGGQPTTALPPCSPASVRGLSSEALLDLRVGFAGLETMFKVPALLEPLDVSRADPFFHEEGFLSQDDPAAATCGRRPARPTGLQALADAERAAASPPGGDMPLPGLNPALLLHGHAALDGMLRDWWHKWARKSSSTSSFHKELAAAASRTVRSSTSPALAEWIKSHGDEHDTTVL